MTLSSTVYEYLPNDNLRFDIIHSYGELITCYAIKKDRVSCDKYMNELMKKNKFLFENQPEAESINAAVFCLLIQLLVDYLFSNIKDYDLHKAELIETIENAQNIENAEKYLSKELVVFYKSILSTFGHYLDAKTFVVLSSLILSSEVFPGNNSFRKSLLRKFD